ncbi:MAG: hypothetical protein J2O48_11125 [Solirubrobacterales bacterium]|nr:hypothetical protein [Solirubrobacterales bacterium]
MTEKPTLTERIRSLFSGRDARSAKPDPGLHPREQADRMPSGQRRFPRDPGADLESELGAEGGERSPSRDTPPGFPARDSASLGDTDQHSKN